LNKQNVQPIIATTHKATKINPTQFFYKKWKKEVEKSIFGKSNGSNGKGNNHNEKHI
jgi:hypothetical protein